MSDIPAELRYTKEHEWIRLEGDVITVGITDYAQHALTDIVWVEFLMDAGAECAEMEAFAAVESVKSVSDIYAPLAGEIVEVNEALQDAPEEMNADAYSAWIAKFRLADPSAVDGLLDAAGYAAVVGE